MNRGEILDPTFEAIMKVSSVITAYLSILLGGMLYETKEIALESIEKTSDVLFQIAQYTGLSSVYSFLTKIVKLIAKAPKLIVTIIKNAIVFFYIFCVLILVGQFDWLLDDINTLTAISLLLTYLTYR